MSRVCLSTDMLLSDLFNKTISNASAVDTHICKLVCHVDVYMTVRSISCIVPATTCIIRYLVWYTRVPLRGRLMPAATLAQGLIQGAERRGQWSGASSDLIMPTATCAELIDLCCAVCLLATSRSDPQHGFNLRKKNLKRTQREDNQLRKQKGEYTRTYRYLVLRMIRGILRSKESTAQCGTAPHRRARHGTARHRMAQRCALLSYSWAELSWAGSAFFVIQQCGTYKPGVVYLSTDVRYFVEWHLACAKEQVGTAKHATRHSTAQHHTARQSTAAPRSRAQLQRTAGHGRTARHGTALLCWASAAASCWAQLSSAGT